MSEVAAPESAPRGHVVAPSTSGPASGSRSPRARAGARSRGPPPGRSHARSYVAYKHTTDPAHMPEAHRRHSAGVDGVLAWASSVGPMTHAMVQRLLDANPVREQGWRSARGLQRVGEKHGPERTELACARALKLGARSYKPVANILELGRERLPLPGEEPVDAPAIDHESVRGPGYYH